MGTYIDWLEELIEIVSDNAVATITDVLAVVAPDGRGLFMDAQTDEDQLEVYMGLRGDPLAWGQYIMDGAMEMEQKLLEAGVPPDEISAVHPFDVVQKFAIQYSAEMEGKLAKSEVGR